MKIASGLVHMLLVATTAMVLVAVGLVVSFGRSGVATTIADEAIASPQARAEVATMISSDLKAAAPLLADIPGVDLLVWEWVDSSPGRSQVRDWIERGVQAQLGQDVGPLLLYPSELIQTNNAFIDTGLRALPPVELQPASVGGSGMPQLMIVFVAAVAVATGSYLGVRRTAGRAHAAVMIGSGGLLAATILILLPFVASSFGALTAIAITTALFPPVFGVLAALSGLLILRAVLAHSELLPYRKSAGFAPSEQGAFDLDFVMLD